MASILSVVAVLDRLWGLTLTLGDLMAAGLAERGLTVARAELMWRLQEAGPVTQRSLSQALRVTPRNVTGLVDALEADGLVARSAHPSDRRATLVSLTERGAETASKLRREQEQFAELLFHDVSASELASFARVTDHVYRRVRETFDQPRSEGDSRAAQR